LDNRKQELITNRNHNGDKSKICTLKDINLTKSGSRVLDVSGSNEVETTETTLLSRLMLVKPDFFFNETYSVNIDRKSVTNLVKNIILYRKFNL
jgi:hypothetical protein